MSKEGAVRRNRWLLRSTVSIGVVVAAAAPAAAHTAPSGCVAAGDTGLTTVMSVTSGQRVHGVIDASACDVGVYVGPGVHDVVISQATITGSHDHGIFVQDATRIRIQHNTLRGDVTSPNPNIAEDKAIELVGTRRSVVDGNLVVRTVGSGGIGLSDDGPLNPGAPNPGNLMPSLRNVVSENTVVHSGTDCGIVLAAYDEGSGGVVRNQVLGNVVRDNVAGIVVATDTPNTLVTGNSVVGNHVTNNFIPGIIIHSNAPGDVLTHTLVAQNTLSGNGPDPDAMGGNGPTTPTAIILAGEVETIQTTDIQSNAIAKSEHFGIWLGNAAATKLSGLRLDRATVPVFQQRADVTS